MSAKLKTVHQCTNPCVTGGGKTFYLKANELPASFLAPSLEHLTHIHFQMYPLIFSPMTFLTNLILSILTTYIKSLLQSECARKKP